MGSPPIRLLASLIIAVAALNFGLIEFADYDLVRDLLAFSEGTTEYQAMSAIVGGAGLLELYNTAVTFLD
ncbi:hypothetical protein C479_14243 [Halovivax asiaticus JCM 14624]|uniref:Uncharacterized protein n=1 Tax=Halovivax asiaticus JCM 14624 TaxID=1227490 RepID=M0BC88_9EURY|nr:hypothetical protein C479_14243 [Halovivax asiaticus JCM 14624]